MLKSKLRAVSNFIAFLLIGVFFVSCSTEQQTEVAPTPPRAGNLLESGELKLVRSDYKPKEITNQCDQAIAQAQTLLDQLASSNQTTQALQTFEKIFADLSDIALPLTFMGYVSKDETLRDEGSSCEEKLSQFNVSVFTRKDLYETLKKSAPSTDDEKRLFSETLKAFESNGLSLPDSELEEVRKLKQELASKETEFSKNLNNDTSFVTYTKEELTGVPASFLARLNQTPEGLYQVTTKSTDYLPVMENAVLDQTRKRMITAYWDRQGKINTQLLEEAIVLRQKIAKRLGYDNWADYRTHDRMAQDAKSVWNFLNDLKVKLAEQNRSDIAQLKAFKANLPESLRDPKAGPEVTAWDIPFLSYQLKKLKYQLDDEEIRDYFPSDTVVKGMFEIYSKLFGVAFVEVTDPTVAKTWSSDVKLYEIQDSQTRETLSYFYADFIPRAGKYGHAAAFPLISGRLLPNGKYSKPVASIVSNFSPPENGKPSRLNHDEVETLFHEFGHIMHQTLTRAPYASLSGTNVAQDFVEAPSQMLENWVWNKDVLKMISGRYDDPTQKLPDDLLKRMLEVSRYQQGYYFTRQLMLALLDMTYHTQSGPVDTTAIYHQLYQELLGVESVVGSHFQAGFGHLMGGYDAGYYGYLWSKVYAEDMFTRFEKATNGVFDASVGEQYRQFILAPGNISNAMDLLKKFLQREPNADAFFNKLGISTSREN